MLHDNKLLRHLKTKSQKKIGSGRLFKRSEENTLNAKLLDASKSY